MVDHLTIFLSGREEITRLGIESPTYSLTFGYLSTIIQCFRVVSDQHLNFVCTLVPLKFYLPLFLFKDVTFFKTFSINVRKSIHLKLISNPPEDLNFNWLSLEFIYFIQLGIELTHPISTDFYESSIFSSKNKLNIIWSLSTIWFPTKMRIFLSWLSKGSILSQVMPPFKVQSWHASDDPFLEMLVFLYLCSPFKIRTSCHCQSLNSLQ